MTGYYLMDNGTRRGPFPMNELKGRGLGPQTQVWREGLTDWVAASNLPELAELLNAPTPPPPPRDTDMPPPVPSATVSIHTGAGALGTSKADDDWILMNPRLPKMARIITVYAIVIGPLLFLFNCGYTVFTADPSDNSQFGSVSMLSDFICSALSLTTTVALAIGGFRLRSMLKGASAICISAILVRLVSFLGLFFIILFLFFVLPGNEAANPNDSPFLNLSACFLATSAYAFDAVAAVWLIRNRHRLVGTNPL